MNKNELAGMIDQTLLSQTATEKQIKEFCITAEQYGFASVCVNPEHVKTAYSILSGTKTKVCTVIDFPLGAGGVESKKTKAKIVVDDGAREFDFVNNLSLVKAHEWEKLELELSEIQQYVNSLSASLNGEKIVTKLILETCLLNDEEIVQSCICAKNAGFDFVKTSTGFAIVKGEGGVLLPNGATPHAVSLMRKTVGPEMGVKASGGIHNTQQALELIECGASRIGASAGIQIVDGL
ncbi:MAG: deoxyribose-phosphate aldolase [Treponema sp.]|nr:deoxyribose-phosphate aldolase [Treponema sp.]